MLLESRLNEKLTLLIDCESLGGVEKAAVGSGSHPDKVMANVVSTVRATALELGNALDTSVPNAPVMMEVEFAVRVDSNSIVSLARNANDGHFRIRLRWDG